MRTSEKAAKQPRKVNFRKIFHKIFWLHESGLCQGDHETWSEGSDIFVGFRCSCGELIGVHRVGE